VGVGVAGGQSRSHAPSRSKQAIRRSSSSLISSSSGELSPWFVVFATGETDKDSVSRAGRNVRVPMRVAVVGDNIQCYHTKKPERPLSPTLTSNSSHPGSNVPSNLDRMQGPDHYRTRPVNITSAAQ
jgi:hypothetical protein